MNILFLDFDLVCNNLYYKPTSIKHPTTKRSCWFLNSYNKHLVKNIRTLCKKYNFKIVVSSTWRKDFNFEELKDVLKQMNLNFELVGTTTKDWLDQTYSDRCKQDQHSYAHDRGMQITKWLNETNYVVNNYLILDDHPGAFYGHTSGYHIKDGFGFNRTHLKKCIKFVDNTFNFSPNVIIHTRQTYGDRTVYYKLHKDVYDRHKNKPLETLMLFAGMYYDPF